MESVAVCAGVEDTVSGVGEEVVEGMGEEHTLHLSFSYCIIQ